MYTFFHSGFLNGISRHLNCWKQLVSALISCTAYPFLVPSNETRKRYSRLEYIHVCFFSCVICDFSYLTVLDSPLQIQIWRCRASHTTCIIPYEVRKCFYLVLIEYSVYRKMFKI